MSFIGRPYTKQVSRSTLQNAISKMGSFKGGRKLHADEFKKICQANPEIKNDPHLSQIAHNIYKSMKGAGVRDIKIKTHHADKFRKVFAQSLQEMGRSGSPFRLTKFGRKMNMGKSIFQKEVVEKELEKSKPTGPSKEELETQRRKQEAIKNLNLYRRAKEIEKEQGRFVLHPEEEKGSSREKDEKKSSAGDSFSSSNIPQTQTSQPRRAEGQFPLTTSLASEVETENEEKDKVKEKEENKPLSENKTEDTEEPSDAGLFEG